MAATMAHTLVAMLTLAPQILVVGGSQGASGTQQKKAPAMSQQDFVRQLRAAAIPKLPVGARLVRIEPTEALRVPQGALQIELALPEELDSGVVDALASLRLGTWQEQVPVRLSIAMLNRNGHLAPVVKRGSEVLVIVRSGNVLVQSMGTAQENGGLEQSISVIPNASGRVVRARVRDARTVEVTL